MTKRAAVRKPPRHAADALMAVFGLYPVKRRRKRKAASELDDDVPDEFETLPGTHLWLNEWPEG